MGRRRSVRHGRVVVSVSGADGWCQPTRTVYLPAGDWFEFWSGKRYPGKQRLQIKPPLEQIPIFVTGGSIIPLAEATLHTRDPASFRLNAQVYGDSPRPAVLYEDDGSWNPSLGEVTLTWNADKKSGEVSRSGIAGGPRYDVTAWNAVA